MLHLKIITPLTILPPFGKSVVHSLTQQIIDLRNNNENEKKNAQNNLSLIRNEIESKVTVFAETVEDAMTKKIGNVQDLLGRAKIHLKKDINDLQNSVRHLQTRHEGSLDEELQSNPEGSSQRPKSKKKKKKPQKQGNQTSGSRPKVTSSTATL